MPGRDEILRSLTGAWRIFLDRPDAMRFFDVTVEGFWRSFRAVFLVLPAYILVMLAEQARIFSDAVPDDDFDSGAFIVNRALALAIHWLALPVALAFLARSLGVTRTYAAYVVARNWGIVLQTAPFGLVALLFLAGLLSGGMASVITLVLVVLVVRFDYLIARRALAADIGLAVALTVVDFGLGIGIGMALDQIISYQPVVP